MIERATGTDRRGALARLAEQADMPPAEVRRLAAEGKLAVAARRAAHRRRTRDESRTTGRQALNELRKKAS